LENQSKTETDLYSRQPEDTLDTFTAFHLEYTPQIHLFIFGSLFIRFVHRRGKKKKMVVMLDCFQLGCSVFTGIVLGVDGPAPPGLHAIVPADNR